MSNLHYSSDYYNVNLTCTVRVLFNFINKENRVCIYYFNIYTLELSLWQYTYCRCRYCGAVLLPPPPPLLLLLLLVDCSVREPLTNTLLILTPCVPCVMSLILVFFWDCVHCVVLPGMLNCWCYSYFRCILQTICTVIHWNPAQYFNRPLNHSFHWLYLPHPRVK